MAVLDHPVFLGEHVSVSYLFTAAGELTEGLGSQWALLGPDLSCDSMGWSVSTPDPWAGCVEVITHISLPCFLNDSWEELLEHDSEGESEVQMGRFHFTAFSTSIMKGSRNPRPEHGGRDCSKGYGGTPLTGLFPRVCSVCFFIQPRITCPGVALSRAGWAPHINH